MSIDPFGILVYAIMVRAFGVYDLSIKFVALTIALAPWVITSSIALVTGSLAGMPLGQLLGPADMVILLLQLAVTVLVLYRIRQTDDDLAAWLGLFIAGAALNYLLVPYLVAMFIAV